MVKIYEAIVWIIKSLFNLLLSAFKAKKNASNQNTVIRMRDAIYQAHKENEDMLLAVNSTIKSLPAKADKTDMDSLDEMQTYCDQQHKSLTQAKDNITLDLSNGAAPGDIIPKYKRIMKGIANINYAMSLDSLERVSKKYAGKLCRRK